MAEIKGIEPIVRKFKPLKSAKTEEELLPWTHWVFEKKYLFLVIDLPLHEQDNLVLMEVKKYAPGQERHFRHLSYADWLVLIEKGAFVETTPKI